MDSVANIDINVPHIARYLCMDVHHLIGLELPCNTQQMRNVSTLHNGHCYCRRRWWLLLGSTAAGENKQDTAQGSQVPENKSCLHLEILRKQGHERLQDVSQRVVTPAGVGALPINYRWARL
jgi:hypothetical protein